MDPLFGALQLLGARLSDVFWPLQVFGEQLPIWVVKILFGICSKKNLEHLVFAHSRQQTKKRFASHDSFQQGTDAKISWLHRKLVPDTQTPAAFFAPDVHGGAHGVQA